MGKKSPAGFSITMTDVDEDAVLFELRRHYKSGISRRIGYCCLERAIEGWYSHSSIHYQKYRNRGFGIVLYTRAIEWAIEHGGIVSSSAGHTKMASRLWQSERLRKVAKIKDINGQYRAIRVRKKTAIIVNDSVKIVRRKNYPKKKLKKLDTLGMHGIENRRYSSSNSKAR